MSEAKTITLLDRFAQLSAPLPAEAYETDNSRGFPLTGIKGAYVIERLNEVLGLCGDSWRFTITSMEIEDKFVLVDIALSYWLTDRWSEPIPASGDQRIVKGRVGDAKKGAVTDALKKAASFLGVGNRAYKGLLKPLSHAPQRPNPKPEKAMHWIDNPKIRTRFWAWAKGTLYMTEERVYQELGVKRIHDFTGTMQDAKRILEEATVGKEEA